LAAASKPLGIETGQSAPRKLTVYWHFLNFSEKSSEGSETSENTSLTCDSSNLQKSPHVAQISDKNESENTMNENYAKQPLPQPLFYDIKQAAVVLNCSTKSVRRLIQRGYFSPCKALRKILIPREQIEAFLKATCDAPNALR
jgi:excisionase family DNA binding protein